MSFISGKYKEKKWKLVVNYTVMTLRFISFLDQLKRFDDTFVPSLSNTHKSFCLNLCHEHKYFCLFFRFFLGLLDINIFCLRLSSSI